MNGNIPAVWHCKHGALTFTSFQGCKKYFYALNREWHNSGVNMAV